MEPPPDDQEHTARRAYWRANVRLLTALLAIWASVAFLLSIVFVEDLNRVRLFGFPLGFWFAQQGSIYVFIGLVLVYAVAMDRIERRFVARSGAAREEASGARDDETDA